MKKSLIYSLILHITLLTLAFFAISEKGGRESAPFFAHIVTPEEIQKEKLLSMPKTLPKAQRELAKMPKLPKDIPPPRELSSIPSTKESKEDVQGLIPNIGSDSKSEDRASEHSKDFSTKKEEAAGKGSPEKPMGKEKLFDKEIIGRLTQRQKEEKSQENNITFDTKEFKYYGYLQRLKEKIEGIWRYPPDAAEKGIYGDLYIRFTIKKDGRLGAIELVRTSGHKSLDDAAIKALKDAEPYWPLPEEWGRDGFTITGHFIYTLYGTYIR